MLCSMFECFLVGIILVFAVCMWIQFASVVLFIDSSADAEMCVAPEVHDNEEYHIVGDWTLHSSISG